MSQPFLGMVILVPYNFAPRNYAFCSGQLMSIAQNTALFSLLGTTYGGDGITTFGLPDLRGRVPISSGQGPGLSNYALGQAAGTESVTLTVNELPSHNHIVNASNSAANASRPGGNILASGSVYQTTAPSTTMNPQMVGLTGGNLPHQNIQPYLTLNYCIALNGIFPSRN